MPISVFVMLLNHCPYLCIIYTLLLEYGVSKKLDDVAILLFLVGTKKGFKVEIVLQVGVLRSIILLNTVVKP